MQTQIVLRDLLFSEELVHFARRCVDELAERFEPSQACEVVVTRENAPEPVVGARLSLPGTSMEPVYETDPDPYLAVRNAVAVMSRRLEQSDVPAAFEQRETA